VCGIAGLYDCRNGGRADPALAHAMGEALAHRGPDGAGLFAWPRPGPRVALAVRRLAIIDLVTGDQPISGEDGKVTIVFNGEIYNHVELRAALRKRGHRLRTESDTEVLVHLYEDYGLDLFGHLRGMYAFALWDGRAERLVLATDHVGMKPLYVTVHDECVRFASEVKALFADPGLPRRVNPDVLDTYLTFGYALGSETLYEGITRLPPGHALIVEGRDRQLIRHSAPVHDRSGPAADPSALADETRELLADAVRLHLRSDVPVGLFLSGGVDSASVLALMRRAYAGSIQTFTVGYAADTAGPPRDDERAPAARVARHFGADHHETVLDAHRWWGALPDYVFHHDEPNANPSAVALDVLAHETAARVKVVLNGTGGDEVFGGYRAHRRIPWLIEHGRSAERLGLPRRLAASPRIWTPLEALYPALRRWRILGALPPVLTEWRARLGPLADGLRRVAAFEGFGLTDGLRDRLYAPPLHEAWRRTRHKESAYLALLEGVWQADPDDLAQDLVMATWLPGNGLLAVDKVTMAHGLEARLPFFDPTVLALGARLPGRLRRRADKSVLRQAMDGTLPPFALARPKQPFGIPLAEWLDGPLAGRVEEVLLDPRALARGLLRPAAVDAIVRDHRARRANHAELLFRLILLELWFRGTVDQPPSPGRQTPPPAGA
jgi:asparagine synthase (glutamine-hydrolysing)